MSNFTYEEKTNNTKLETFEWDNVWWEHTENSTAKRVVYIGDSISCGTRHIATELSGNEILFDGFGTSKSLDNPYFKDSLSIFMKQETKVDAILFNNGLHGWHLSNGEYEEEYREMLKFLKALSNAPVFIVLTTSLPAGEAERKELVIARNGIAQKLAGEFGLKVIDLYSVSECNTDLYFSDNVHFTREGYEELAKCILASLKDNIA